MNRTEAEGERHMLIGNFFSPSSLISLIRQFAFTWPRLASLDYVFEWSAQVNLLFRFIRNSLNSRWAELKGIFERKKNCILRFVKKCWGPSDLADLYVARCLKCLADNHNSLGMGFFSREAIEPKEMDESFVTKTRPFRKSITKRWIGDKIYRFHDLKPGDSLELNGPMPLKVMCACHINGCVSEHAKWIECKKCPSILISTLQTSHSQARGNTCRSSGIGLDRGKHNAYDHLCKLRVILLSVNTFSHLT